MKEKENQKLLTEEELENTAGGDFGFDATQMKCSACNVDGRWAGNYEGQFFDYPKCGGQGTLEGVSYLGKNL